MSAYLAAIHAATPEVVDRGHRVLHGAMLADTEAGHIRVLAALMDLPRGALVADLGCGIGEVARLMAADRPDLRWVQVNLSEPQIRQADGVRVVADFHHLPLADASVDAVLFLFSLCHGDLAAALREAIKAMKKRVARLRPDATLAGFTVQDGTQLWENPFLRARLRAAISERGSASTATRAPASSSVSRTAPAATVSPFSRPGPVAAIPELAEEAKEPPRPASCQPTCAEGWTKLKRELSSLQTVPPGPATSASGSTAR